MDDVETVIRQIDSWCIENFGNDSRNWNTTGSISYDFSKSELSNLFILRWGSYMQDNAQGIIIYE